MAEPLIVVGEKVIIITRRAFAEDVSRHFIGEVMAASEGLIRVEGYAWVASSIGTFERRSEIRIRMFSLDYGGEIVLIAPPDLDIHRVRYTAGGGRLSITDGADFSMDISEFGVGR